MNPTLPERASALHTLLREHIESVAPGDAGILSQELLGQNTLEFQETIALLRDLERAGALVLGAINNNGSVEFERLA